jgi:hypothetical protein
MPSFRQFKIDVSLAAVETPTNIFVSRIQGTLRLRERIKPHVVVTWIRRGFGYIGNVVGKLNDRDIGKGLMVPKTVKYGGTN